MKNKLPSNPKGSYYIQTVGRRREATARVRVYPLEKTNEVIVDSMPLAKGAIVVNKHPAAQYFPGELNEKLYRAPLRAANVDSIAVTAQVTGGGKSGQLGAFTLGLARALDKMNKDYHNALKKRGLLTRDPRIRERRKVGLAGRARAKKSSPKR